MKWHNSTKPALLQGNRQNFLADKEGKEHLATQHPGQGTHTL